jgi:hypothetical protein
MRYFLDTEFNGFGGPLISLALVREDGPSLYLLYGLPEEPTVFVKEQVAPKLRAVPADIVIREVDQAEGAAAIEAFLDGDASPEVIADWPDDIRLFCQALMLRPGLTVGIDRLGLEIHRVVPYPTELEDAVEHNAWWDAMALKVRLQKETDRSHRGHWVEG